jgi:hypothetical protein
MGRRLGKISNHPLTAQPYARSMPAYVIVETNVHGILQMVAVEGL